MTERFRGFTTRRCVNPLYIYLCVLELVAVYSLGRQKLRPFPFPTLGCIIICHNNSVCYCYVNVTAKDFVGCKSRVCVLGPEDGRAKLADIARQLSAQVAMQRLSLDSLTIPYVDSVVQGKFAIPVNVCISDL